MAVKVGSFNVTTQAAGNTVDITDVGFQPVVVLFWWSGRTDTVDAQGEQDMKGGFGWARSSTSRACAAWQVDHGLTTMQCHNVNRNDSCIASITTAGATDGLMDFNSFLSNGFRLTIDDAFATSLRVHYLAMDASTCTQSASGSSAIPTSTGSRSNTGAGFQPNCVFFVTGDGFAALNTIDTWVMAHVGVACGGSTPSQGCLTARSEGDGIGTSITHRYCNNDDAFAISFGGADLRMQVTGWLSTGWTENWVETQGAASHDYLWLALALDRVSLTTFTTQTNTSTAISLTGHGAQPIGALFFSAGHTAETTLGLANSAVTHAQQSIGAYDGTNQRAAAYLDKNAAASADCGVAVEHDAVYIHQSTAATIAIDGLMAATGFTSDGVDCLMSDADPAASFGWAVLIGEADTGITGTLDVTLAPLTSAATGTVDVAGSAAVTLGALTLSSTGTVDVVGDVTQTLGALTLAATGTVDVTGALSTTLEALTLSSAGTVDVAGALSATLDPLTGAATGTVDVAGALAVTLDALTLDAQGIVGDAPIEGQLDVTLDVLTLASTGVVDVAGQLSGTLEALMLSSAGTVSVGGAADVTLGALTSAATGTVSIAGAATLTLGDLTLQALGAVEIRGVLDVTLDALTALPESLYQPVAHPGECFSTVITTGSTGADLGG